MLPPGFRKGTFVEGMRRRGLDYVLLTTPENVFYATGYTCLPSSQNPILYTLRNQYPYGVWISREGEVVLVCWSYSVYGVQFGADKVLGFHDLGGALNQFSTLMQSAVEQGAVIGVESECPFRLIRLYEEVHGKADHLRTVDDLLITERLIKSPAEIALLSKSVAVAERTVQELFSTLKLGMSRLDLIAEAKYRAIRNGATGISHITASFGEENPEVGIPERLDPNHLVTVDVGAIVDGYCSDNRRYAYTGDIPPALQEKLDAMVEVVDGVGDALRPGTPYKELNELARRLHEERRLQPFFNHVGHNMGLATEEDWIIGTSDRSVEAGMFINLEIYTPVFEIKNAIGTEESYAIDADGPRRISQLPRVIYQV